MDLLLKCPALVELTVSTESDPPNNSPARTHPHLTLSALESLSANLGPPNVLQRPEVFPRLLLAVPHSVTRLELQVQSMEGVKNFSLP
ncbi:hypothetical protein C8J57DRAFT_1518002 [Mycena rebaudengoi]|nr:hypothetical protein C8J57DRAFT_1518002 [Mycena rebaudengoi]